MGRAILSREDFPHQRGATSWKIAHQIGCFERAVRRHLAREEAHTGRPAKLEPYKAIADQLMADNSWNAVVINTMGYLRPRTKKTKTETQTAARKRLFFKWYRRSDSNRQGLAPGGF